MDMSRPGMRVTGAFRNNLLPIPIRMVMDTRHQDRVLDILISETFKPGLSRLKISASSRRSGLVFHLITSLRKLRLHSCSYRYEHSWSKPNSRLIKRTRTSILADRSSPMSSTFSARLFSWKLSQGTKTILRLALTEKDGEQHTSTCAR